MSAARLFQSTRRRVQRRVVTAVLSCGLLLIGMYALIVVGTGIFVLYLQLNAASEMMNGGGAVQIDVIQQAEFVDEREEEEEDPIVRLLRAADGVAGMEGVGDEDEARQIREAAAAVDAAFLERRVPVEFGMNRWWRFRRFGGGRGRRKKRAVDFETNGTTSALPTEETRTKRAVCPLTPPVLSTPSAPSDAFPTNLFSVTDRQRGVVLLHLAALCYIFIALAIVCDYFLVPSISVLSDVLGISDDVAGATLMAGAGSMPEAFTSLFGVFVTQNNVGIGTIVGSATFNILFVLALCAFFSRQVLHLTWYPLLRDIAFYLVALFLLIVFFFDQRIDWYEALVLFLFYVSYCIFMRYNGPIEQAVKRRLSVWSAKVSVENSNLVENANTKVIHRLSIRDLPAFTTERTIPLLHSGAIFRGGLLQIALEPAALAAPSESDRTSLPGETSHLTTPQPLFTKRFSQPVMRTGTPLLRVENASSPTPSSPSTRHPSARHLTPTSRSPTPSSQVWSTVSSASNLHEYRNRSPTDGQPNGSCRPSGKNEAKRRRSADPEADLPLDMSWPSGAYKRSVYLFLAPITFPLYWTLADVKRPEKRKFYLWSFVGSVLWIAALSYVMVWMANTIGETFGIPNEVMGLTVLAAGTSVPDLITSIIVARKGLGDMAVSSSIGSNLFDICVGLPLPWLLYYAIHAFGSEVARISVESKGLVCSIAILFTTLSILYLSLVAIGWKMNRTFGVLMLVAYFLFCTLSVLLEMDILVCPLREVSVC